MLKTKRYTMVAGKHDTWLNADDKKQYFKNVKKWRRVREKRIKWDQILKD